MIYIESLEAIDKNGKISSVTFGRNLNIIIGPSNCGKTMILKCIDYLFGGKTLPFDVNQYSVSCVKMKLVIDDGYIFISRDIGSPKIFVTGNSRFIKNGEYSTNVTKDSSLTFGQACLGLLRIPQGENPIRIFTTKEAKTGTLSIRQLASTFIIKENDIICSNSIFNTEKINQLTAVKSALLFLLTGNNFLTGKEKDPDWLKDKNTNLRYIQKKLQELETKYDWLTQPIYIGYEDTLIEKGRELVSNLDKEYSDLQAKYQDTIIQYTILSTKQAKLSESLASKKDYFEKCHILLDEYKSDIKRLRFIIDGNDVFEATTTPDHCPFCGNEMKPEKSEDYKAAAREEAKSLLPKLEDLAKEITETEEEIKLGEEELVKVASERNAITAFLDTNYHPKVRSIKSQILQYGELIKDAQERALIRKDYEAINKEVSSIKKEIQEAVTEFNPDDHLNDFEKAMTEKISKILSTCNFQDGSNATFDLSTFDVRIGKLPKSCYGKGYIAYLNSVVAFALHEVIEEVGKYKELPLIIDSPMTALKEEEKEAHEFIELKKPLIAYFQNSSKAFQTIIIDNELPKIDYDNTTNIIRFGDAEGKRHGFLSDD